jgi:hypothetical protein
MKPLNPVTYRDLTQPTVEAAYQALSPEDKEVINAQAKRIIDHVKAGTVDEEDKKRFGRIEALQVLARIGVFLLVGPSRTVAEVVTKNSDIYHGGIVS